MVADNKEQQLSTFWDTVLAQSKVFGSKLHYSTVSLLHLSVLHLSIAMDVCKLGQSDNVSASHQTVGRNGHESQLLSTNLCAVCSKPVRICKLHTDRPKETQHNNQQNDSRDVAVRKTLEPHYYVVTQHTP